MWWHMRWCDKGGMREANESFHGQREIQQYVVKVPAGAASCSVVAGMASLTERECIACFNSQKVQRYTPP